MGLNQNVTVHELLSLSATKSQFGETVFNIYTIIYFPGVIN